MSRIGKKAVAVPSGVTAGVEGQTVKVKGPKGALQLVLHDDVEARVDGGAIKIDPRAETRRARAMWGLARSQVANLTGEPGWGFLNARFTRHFMGPDEILFEFRPRA